MTTRILITLMITVLLTVLTVGCVASSPTSGDTPPTTTTMTPPTTSLAAATSTRAAEITADDAKTIALADAGFAESDVTRLRVEFDRDDGRAYYDVSFVVDNTEYDYDIDITSGAIIEKDTERNDW